MNGNPEASQSRQYATKYLKNICPDLRELCKGFRDRTVDYLEMAITQIQLNADVVGQQSLFLELVTLPINKQLIDLQI